MTYVPNNYSHVFTLNFDPKKARIKSKFIGKKIYILHNVPDFNKRAPDWEKGIFKGLKSLLDHFDDYFNGDDFTLIFNNSEKRYSINGESSAVFISLKKWFDFEYTIERITKNYKISKYYFDLSHECKLEGIKNYFSDKDPDDIIPHIDQSIYSIVEKMLLEFDSLSKNEQNTMLKTFEESKPARLILKKYGKLNKNSVEVQVKSLANNADKITPAQVFGLVNEISKSKISNKVSKKFSQLPVNFQSEFIKNTSQEAKYTALVSELESSLKSFKKLIKERYSSKQKNERQIHKFLASNYWLLGIEYYNQIIKTDINKDGEKTKETSHSDWHIYPDFEIYRLNGAVEKCVVIEIEEANDKIFNLDGTFSKSALDGLYQSITYSIYHTIKRKRITQGIAILGYTKKLTAKQEKDLEKLNFMLPCVKIMTYNDLINNAQNTIDFVNKQLSKNK